MGKVAAHPSIAIAELLRRRREEMGLSLRDVESRSEAAGERVHFATLARAEQGKAELGTRRLWRLFRLYDLPIQLAADLLELEELAGDGAVPAGPFEDLGREGARHLKAGNAKEALAHFFAVRSQVPTGRDQRVNRQRAILGMAVAAGSLGRISLSRHMVEGLLFEPPDPSILVATLVQAAKCWQCLGSLEGALGFLSRAEVHIKSGQHRERGWVLHEKASILAELGNATDAGETARAAISSYRRAGDKNGEAAAHGVQVKVLLAQEAWKAALRAARAARDLARKHGLERLVASRGLDEARALRELGEPFDALNVLKEVTAWAVQKDDRVVRFYAHHALWKTHEALGDADRASLELRSAGDYAKFVDELTPETREIKSLGAVAVAGKGRREERARRRRTA